MGSGVALEGGAGAEVVLIARGRIIIQGEEWRGQGDVALCHTCLCGAVMWATVGRVVLDGVLGTGGVPWSRWICGVMGSGCKGWCSF